MARVRPSGRRHVDLDYAAIHEMVTRRPGDFDEFGRHVLAYLEREED